MECEPFRQFRTAPDWSGWQEKWHGAHPPPPRCAPNAAAVAPSPVAAPQLTGLPRGPDLPPPRRVIRRRASLDAAATRCAAAATIPTVPLSPRRPSLGSIGIFDEIEWRAHAVDSWAKYLHHVILAVVARHLALAVTAQRVMCLFCNSRCPRLTRETVPPAVVRRVFCVIDQENTRIVRGAGAATEAVWL